MSDGGAPSDKAFSPIARSRELMNPDDTGLLVIDVQAKLVPSIEHHARIVWNIRRLLDAADAMGVAKAATEQYPSGLGSTVEPLAGYFGEVPSKLAFSCGGCSAIFADWTDRGIHRVLLCGIETHVCVQQTALDLLAAGFGVYLAVDAIGARHSLDHETALRRIESSGGVLTTTEAALFEWCQEANRPPFKTISALVKEVAPNDQESSP